MIVKFTIFAIEKHLKHFQMNIVYSLTNRTYSVIRGITFALLGISLLIWPALMLDLIVKILAVFLIASACVSLIVMFRQRKRYRKIIEQEDPQWKNERSFLSSFSFVSMVVNIIFGLLIFIFPSFFVSILVFLFGAILLVLGISQLANIALSSRYMKMSAMIYIFPSIITICGILLFFQPFTAKDVLTMFFGGCVTVYGIIELISAWKFRKIKFSLSGKYIRTGSPDDVEDAEYQEIMDSETGN